MEFYSAIRKSEAICFEGKWKQLEDIMLSELSQAQKDKDLMVFLICEREIQYLYKQYEKQAMLREGH
jgi:hypothetical protein